MIVSETSRVIGMGVVRQLRTRSFHQYYKGWYPGCVPICELDCFFIIVLASTGFSSSTLVFFFSNAHLQIPFLFEMQKHLLRVSSCSERMPRYFEAFNILKICIQLINLLLSLEFQVSKFISVTLTPKSASATKYPKAFEVVLLNVTGGAK